MAKHTTRAFTTHPGRQELGCCTLLMLISSISAVVQAAQQLQEDNKCMN